MEILELENKAKNYTIVADSRVMGIRPIFSVTIALYDVEKYLPATIKAFKRQDIADEHVEYIFVDDGSPDASADIAKRFAQRHKNVLVVSKENGGVGETRSVALLLSRGEWVTSVDPDDLIRYNYFSEIKKFLDADTENRISIISPRIYIANGETGEFRDSHPLGAKHRGGNRVISMTSDPSAIHLAASVFTRLDVLREHGINYNPDIKPTFEDAHLICRYLSHFDDPVIALASTAHFYYRKRANQSSLVQSAWKQPERYTVTPRLGYIDVLQYAQKQLGYTPNWMANVILYDLMWYFKEESRMGSDASSIAPELKQAFVENLKVIFEYISLSQFLSLPYNKVHWWMKEAIIRKFGLDPIPAYAYKFGMDNEGRHRYSLFVAHGEHKIEVFVDGKLVKDGLEGITNRLCFDQVFATEYKFALPVGWTVFIVDGIRIRNNAERPQYEITPEHDPYLIKLTKDIRNIPVSHPVLTKAKKIRSRWRVSAGIRNKKITAVATEKTLNYAKTKLSHIDLDDQFKQDVTAFMNDNQRIIKYQDCWILLDHPDRADDNAEHLYRYILDNRGDINAYFMLQRESKDWTRLESEGFKLLEYGTIEATAALLVAKVLASSDAIEECMYPAPRRIFGIPNYKYVFLQHGITVTDISKWLNTKRIDLIISATEDEYNAFALSPESAYEFKAQEVALTGFARYDSLMQPDNAVKKTEVPTLFIMPTWRNNMRNLLATCETDEERASIFKSTEYYQKWWGLFNHPELLAMVNQKKLNINLVLHPAFGNLLDSIEIPQEINFFKPGQSNFQELIKSSDMFLTDFSSLIFDCSYIGMPTCYFQFDYESVFSGQHTYRKGYFDYFENGLAPVLTEEDSVIKWIVEKAQDTTIDPIYAERRKSTFRYFDRRNRERIVEAIENLF